jgi:hypothetical protein
MLSSSTYAQTGTATVRGTVSDQQGALVPGATITLRSAGKDFTRSQTTDDYGSYAFKMLPPDTYIIQVEAPQFKKALVSNVNAEANLALDINITLEEEFSELSTGALARARVTDIKPPLVMVRSGKLLSLCGSRSYLVKDSAGGYLMFTLHTPDMPDPLTVDNPLPSSESLHSADPASNFESGRPLNGTEEELLVKLLREWRDSAIPKQKLRRFRQLARLRDDATIRKALKRLSQADSDLLSVWFDIRELERKRK